MASDFKLLSADMNPFVLLKRLSPSLLRRKGVAYLGDGLPAELQSSELVKATGKKSGKKGAYKNYLHRVNNLLKSTLDYWVTIKHELEVHVKTAEMLPVATEQELEEDHHCSDAVNMDDFQLPILKIKIKREQGTLNYTLVDEAKESVKKKNKKKCKDAEKQREKVVSIVKKKLHYNYRTI